MPTYAYLCNDCGHEFEIVQAMTDGTLTVCPQCQGTLRKVFHPVGVAFKGSGFYRTDSRAGSGPDGAKIAAKKDNADAAAKSPSKYSDSSGSSGSSSDSGSSSSSSYSSSSSSSSGSSNSGSSNSGSSGSSSKPSSSGSSSSS